MDRPSACDDIAILYVALELSKSSWLVALNAPGSNKISQHAVTGGDLAGLLALIERARTAAEARLGRPVRAVSCYEAGYDGFWLHRALTGAGIENRVLDPASIPVDRGRRRAKTDNIDVIGLMRILMALLRGESKVSPWRACGEKDRMRGATAVMLAPMRESGDSSNSLFHKEKWIPAFAGKTLRTLHEPAVSSFHTLEGGKGKFACKRAANGGANLPPAVLGARRTAPFVEPRAVVLHLRALHARCMTLAGRGLVASV